MLNGTGQVLRRRIRTWRYSKTEIYRTTRPVCRVQYSVFGGEKNGIMKVARRAPELTTHHVFFADLWFPWDPGAGVVCGFIDVLPPPNAVADGWRVLGSKEAVTRNRREFANSSFISSSSGTLYKWVTVGGGAVGVEEYYTKQSRQRKHRLRPVELRIDHTFVRVLFLMISTII